MKSIFFNFPNQFFSSFLPTNIFQVHQTSCIPVSSPFFDDRLTCPFLTNDQSSLRNSVTIRQTLIYVWGKHGTNIRQSGLICWNSPRMRDFSTLSSHCNFQIEFLQKKKPKHSWFRIYVPAAPKTSTTRRAQIFRSLTHAVFWMEILLRA